MKRELDVSIVLRQRPGPYQVVMLGIALLGGLEIIVRGYGIGGRSGEPSWTIFLLGGALVLTSSIALTGILMAVRQQSIAGPLIERAGIFAQAVLLTVYTAIVLAESGARAIVTVTFFLGFVIAGAWRIAQINRQVREIRDRFREVASR